MTHQDIHPNQTTQTIDGAGQESKEPLSGEPSGRSDRDGLSAAPSPVRTLSYHDWILIAVAIVGTVVFWWVTRTQ